MMEEILLREIVKKYKPKEILIISSKCPMKDSVDNWAVAYMKKNGFKIQEYPPRKMNRDGFFDINKEMALHSLKTFAFVNNGQRRSGIWNMIKWVRYFGGGYVVYDENGKIWDRDWKNLDIK